MKITKFGAKYLTRLSILFIILLTLGACKNSERSKLVNDAPLISKTFTDDRGQDIILPQSAEKVISIAPNITEIVFAIGGEKKLVGRSQACNYPPDASFIQEIATYPQLDLEGMKGLASDLIITTDEIFSPDAVAQIERLDMQVYLQSYHTMEDIYKGIRDIGDIFEQTSSANHIADSLQSLEKRIIERTKDKAKYRTMILISNDPLKVVGGDGFLNELIQKAGGKNIFGEKQDAYYSTTVEEIIQMQPEYIILPSKDEQIYQKLLAQYPYLQNTPADINKQVFLINPDLLYRPGPRMLQGLLQLTNILHSDLNADQFLESDE